MTEATLTASDDGVWRVRGALDFTSVPQLWPALERVLAPNGDVTLSLGGVEQTNSAGLVLLVEALSVARKRGCALHLADVPDDLQALATMSGCEELLFRDAA